MRLAAAVPGLHSAAVVGSNGLMDIYFFQWLINGYLLYLINLLINEY